MNLSLSDITHIGNHWHPCWHSASDTGVTARLSPALDHLGKNAHPTATLRLASCRSLRFGVFWGCLRNVAHNLTKAILRDLKTAEEQIPLENLMSDGRSLVSLAVSVRPAVLASTFRTLSWKKGTRGIHATEAES